MSGPQPSTQADELLVVLLAGMIGLGAVAGAAVVGWERLIGWLVEHQVLLAATHNPAVIVPYTGGTGLDRPRLAVLTALVLLGLLAGRVLWRGRRPGEQRR